MKEKYTATGRILKSSGGLFTVRFDTGEHPLSGARAECRARGTLRGGRVLPGDIVEICYGEAAFSVGEDGTASPAEDSAGLPDAAICGVADRKNCLIRPPMANLDLLIVIIAAARPDPSLPNIDRLLSCAEYYSLDPAIVITKCDLSGDSADELESIYGRAGYPVFRVAEGDDDGVIALSSWLSGKLPGHTAAFAGVSGAGKSTLMNRLFPSLELRSGEVSRKNGRGKQTTRTVELFEIPYSEGTVREGLIADTPGFSSIDFENFDFLPFEALPDTMREFRSCYGDCRWLDCTHTGEKDCGVAKAVREGRVAASRHESYREMYSILKAKHAWDKK